ncbi:DUF922 domain-containing protein [Gramella sp. KN1008]|uniref:DUF922 domain-containing protein n=1 Tax=Gramella sp. KN1008 TaxID=2529298 RepID=UPI001040D44A|nr:DUF922 domain-containing protein [Gramella sp. KN1008]TBW28505.1 DUF922 domain-containing protein [Gramella sp. KN1008]
MRALIAILVLVFACNFKCFSQEKKEKLRWQEDRPLRWEDFKAEPDESTSYSANTNSGIAYSWDYSTASGKPVLNHEVTSNFYPNLSWVKDIKEKEYLLAHEQLHFDITELHARKLRKALAEYEIGRNIRLDLKRIYNNIETERTSMQKLFDKETGHSENREAEMRWRKYISGELEKLKEFSS